MAGKTLVDADNLLQLCSDMIAVKEALIEVGVDIPNGTPSSRYGELIKELFASMHKDNLKTTESETTESETTESETTESETTESETTESETTESETTESETTESETTE